MLEEHRDAALARVLCAFADAVEEACPRLFVRRLERVVVALDSGPDDEVRPYLGSEIDRAAMTNLNRGGAAILFVTLLLIGVLLATRISLVPGMGL